MTVQPGLRNTGVAIVLRQLQVSSGLLRETELSVRHHPAQPGAWSLGVYVRALSRIAAVGWRSFHHLDFEFHR
jgi:hypothetical protein